MALNMRSLERDKLVKLYADLPRKSMRLLTLENPDCNFNRTHRT